jgi:hypothetical protein
MEELPAVELLNTTAREEDEAAGIAKAAPDQVGTSSELEKAVALGEPSR